MPPAHPQPRDNKYVPQMYLLLLPGVSLASCVGIFAPLGLIFWYITKVSAPTWDQRRICFPKNSPWSLLCLLLFISVHYFNKGYFLCLQDNSSQWKTGSLLVLFTSSIWKGIACSKALLSWDLSVALDTPSFENMGWTTENQGCNFRSVSAKKPEKCNYLLGQCPSGPCLGLNLTQDNKALPDSLSMRRMSIKTGDMKWFSSDFFCRDSTMVREDS